MGLLKAKAPALPLPTSNYSQDQQNQLSNALRLYFNQIDTAYWDGVKVVNPYGAIQDSTDQYATAANTATQILFDTTDFTNSMEHVVSDGLRVVYPGIYNCQFSVQFVNSDTQIHDASIWLKKKANGAGSSSNIAGTGSKYSIPNKHGGVNGNLIAAVNFYVELAALDALELWWEGTQTATSGGATGIYLETYAATASIPSVPSAVLTLTYVSAIPT